MPLALTCEAAVDAAFAALPAVAGGPAVGEITSIQFGFGRYCPPGERCLIEVPNGDGFVVFVLRDGPSYLASVQAGQTGAVSVTRFSQLSPTGLPVSS
jgi:hypothetical protein